MNLGGLRLLRYQRRAGSRLSHHSLTTCAWQGYATPGLLS